jgi:hypothetical protein
VPPVLFQTLHVFFVIRLANREILHAAVTRHPTADWAAQQIVECLRLGSSATAILDSRSRQPLWRELRSSRAVSEYGKFVRRSDHPEPMPVAERWVRSARSECLEGYTTFTALLHDTFLRPTGHLQRNHPIAAALCARD